jgi:hypothetical protein
MPNLLSRLSKSERARFLEELNYMNLEEIRGFCAKRGIPYRIVAESPDGKVKATKDTDRKPIVLARVRRYLRTGMAGAPVWSSDAPSLRRCRRTGSSRCWPRCRPTPSTRCLI